MYLSIENELFDLESISFWPQFTTLPPRPHLKTGISFLLSTVYMRNLNVPFTNDLIARGAILFLAN